MQLDVANDTLRFALNEMRAIDGGEELPSDRKTCASRLRLLANNLEAGGICPDANAIIREAASLPIQR